LVLTDGLKAVTVGIVAGLVASLALGRFVTAFLFGVGAMDVSTFVGTTSVFCVITGLACLVPALRAARVDPATALRAD
jgi:ABC-type antimicrobial peptide transport system permease subunit